LATTNSKKIGKSQRLSRTGMDYVIDNKPLK
jgi:hypothetical protein